MKKLTSAALVLTLTLSTALAASGGYAGTVTLNGTELDTAGLPASPTEGAGIPLRTVAEADYGFADWYADEGRAFFSLDENRVYVDGATGEIELNGRVLSDMTAAFSGGVTFVPADFINRLEGYSATAQGQRVDISSPNGDALVRLARSIISTVDMGASLKEDLEGMAERYGIPADCFTEAVGFFPMMISADTVVIGKVADGKGQEAREALESLRANTQKNFEQYLPEPLARAKNGQVVTEGDYVMLIISADNAAAISLFRAGVPG